MGEQSSKQKKKWFNLKCKEEWGKEDIHTVQTGQHHRHVNPHSSFFSPDHKAIEQIDINIHWLM